MTKRQEHNIVTREGRRAAHSEGTRWMMILSSTLFSKAMTAMFQTGPLAVQHLWPPGAASIRSTISDHSIEEGNGLEGNGARSRRYTSSRRALASDSSAPRTGWIAPLGRASRLRDPFQRNVPSSQRGWGSLSMTSASVLRLV